MLEDAARFRHRQAEQWLIPEDLGDPVIPGLSTQIREPLSTLTPRSLDQAFRVPGVAPAGSVHFFGVTGAEGVDNIL